MSQTKYPELWRRVLEASGRFDIAHMRLDSAKAKAGLRTDPRGQTFPTLKDEEPETYLKEILWFNSETIRCIAQAEALESGKNADEVYAAIADKCASFLGDSKWQP